MKLSYNPKVSIITAVKNNADFISRAIVSIMNQTYDNIEHIMVRPIEGFVRGQLSGCHQTSVGIQSEHL